MCESETEPSINGHKDLPENLTLSPGHIKFEGFTRRLQTSITNFFPSNAYRYKEAHVLLLSWKDNDLGVIDEVQDLQGVFEESYQYTSVERWAIPSLKPHTKLEERLYDFKKEHSSIENLLIVYYAGHGFLDDSRRWK